MKRIYSVTIIHDFHDPSRAQQHFRTFESQEELEEALAQDFSAYSGGREGWRAAVEMVYVPDEEAFEQEKRRLAWVEAEIRALNGGSIS